MLAIGVLAQASQMRSDFMHQHFTLRRLRDVNHFLNDVIGILIFHHHIQCTVRQEKKEINNNY